MIELKRVIRRSLKLGLYAALAVVGLVGFALGAKICVVLVAAGLGGIAWLLAVGKPEEGE